MPKKSTSSSGAGKASSAKPKKPKDSPLFPHASTRSCRKIKGWFAGRTLDEIAVDLIMGHGAADDDMGRRYTQWIGDDRLKHVASHVRTWLLGTSRPSKKQE